jgi:hypothetical protein
MVRVLARLGSIEVNLALVAAQACLACNDRVQVKFPGRGVQGFFFFFDTEVQGLDSLQLDSRTGMIYDTRPVP